MRIAKRILLGAAVTLAVLLVLAAAAMVVLLRTQAGQDWLTATATRYLTNPDGSGITIGSIAGALPGEVRVSGIAVRDSRGTWLDIDSVRVVWDPWALLSRKVDVGTLDVAGVHVARLPVADAPSAPRPTEPFQLPQVPVAIAVDRMVVTGVELAEPALGIAATLHARGRLGASEAGTLRTELVVERTDGSQGSVELNAEYAQQRDELRLALSVAEPSGGLIARTLALPDLPPVTITLNGTGPLTQWEGKLVAALGETLGADANLTLGRTGADYSVELTGKARIAGIAPEAVRPLVANGVDVALEGRMQGRVLDLQRARVVASGATAAVSARVDLDRYSIEGNAEFNVPDASVLQPLIAPAFLDRLDLRATFTGPLLSPRLQVRAETPRIVLPQVELADIAADVAIIPAGALDGGFRGTVSLNAKATTIKPLMEKAEPITGPLSLTVEAIVDQPRGKAEITRLALASPQMDVTGKGHTDLSTLATEADLDLVLPALAPLAPLLGTPISGAAHANATIRAGAGLNELTALLSATLTDVGPAGTPLASILGKKTLFKAEIRTDKAGEHRGEIRAEMPSANVAADATVSAALDRISGDYRINVPQLQAFSTLAGTELAGRLAVTGKVNGPLTDPHLAATLRIEDAAVAQQTLGRVDGQLRVDSPATGARGRFEISAAPASGRVALATDFAVAKEQLNFTGIKIESRGEALTGQFAVPLGGGAINGTLAGRIGDMGPLLAVAGMKGGGSGSLRLRLFGERKAQAGEATVELRDVRIDQNGSEVRVGRVALDGRATVGNPIRLDATASIGDLRSGAARVDSATLTVGGNLDRLALTLAVRGDMDGPFTTAADATVTLQDKGFAASLTRLQGVVKNQRIALRGPARVSWRPDRVEVRDVDMALASGSLRADLEMQASKVAGTIDLTTLPLSFVRAFVPGAEASGALSSRVRFNGTLADPNGTMTLSFADIRFRQARELRPLNGRVDASWRGGIVEARTSIGGFARQPIEATARLPLRLSDSFVPIVPPDGPIAASVNWQGEIEPLVLLLPLPDHRIQGVATVALGVGGTVSAPKASGTISLARGEYENLLTGTILDRMELTAEAQGDRIVLSRFTARDGARGNLQATGYAAFDGMPARIDVVLTNFTVARRDDVTGDVDANISYSANEDGGRVAGKITTGAVEIRLINRLPPEVVDLAPIEKGGGRVARIVKPAEVKVPTTQKTGIALAIQIEMPSRIFVRGRGLDSEWSGSFAIQGTANSPDISGQLRSVRGQVSVLNTVFQLRPSTIRLAKSGKGTFDVVLDITAAREATDLTVLVKITGTAASPKLEFTSEPELPQDEVLAHVLFGKNTGQLTAVEAVQLAAAVAELTGMGGGGGGVLDFTRKALGLDVLRVGAGSGASAATVTAGKYIARNVFVGVEQGTSTESSAATVEIEVFPNVKIQSRIGQSGASGVGVKAEWDY